MSRAVENRDDKLLDGLVLRPCQRTDVLADGLADIDNPDRFGPGHDFVHIEDGRSIQHAAPIGHCDHRNRVLAPGCGERRAVNRIDRNVATRTTASAHVLPVVQHGCLIFLTLADHHHPVEIDGTQELAHRIDGRLIGRILISAADERHRTDRCRLRRPDQLHGEVAVGVQKQGGVFGRHRTSQEANRGQPGAVDVGHRIAVS